MRAVRYSVRVLLLRSAAVGAGCGHFIVEVATVGGSRAAAADPAEWRQMLNEELWRLREAMHSARAAGDTTVR